MTAQGNIINLIEYYMSHFGVVSMFDKNIISIFHKNNKKSQLLNNYVNNL